MGTDIHGVFQRRTETGWEDVPSTYEQHRHYQLFAVLADVRNGYGFAGIATGEAVKPIASPRGLPDDFVMNGGSHPLATIDLMTPWRQQYHTKHATDEPLEVWMGDHSHSWLTADEMLAWAEAAPVVVKQGCLTRAQYEQWDKTSPPDPYCGDAWGQDVVMVNDNAVEMEQAPNWTYVRCTWQRSLKDELGYFFEEVARLKSEHGDVRFVFGFDS